LTVFREAPYNPSVHTLITMLAVRREESGRCMRLARSLAAPVSGLCFQVSGLMTDRLGLRSVSR
jgi:hypothetical protein